MTDPSPILAALVNGETTTSISLLDRGFAYGDGVFETIRIDRHDPYLWAYHCQRLINGCQRLNIPFTDTDLLEREINLLCEVFPKNSPNRTKILKIIISRGREGYSYRYSEEIQPTRVLWVMLREAFPVAYYQEGVAVTICRHHLSKNVQTAGIKHLNRLDQVIARSEWKDEYFEGLMLDGDGYVIEGTMSNLFIFQNKELLTPEVVNCGVAGVMREYILSLENHGFRCSKTRLTIDQILEAQGAFICNSVMGIIPIRQVNQTKLPLSPMLHDLQALVGMPPGH